jgi:hypothetical protein
MAAVLMKDGRAVSRWLLGCRLLMMAFVALSCSDSGASAYALCDGCPDLFASIAIAQQATPAQPRAQSTRLHGRDVNPRRQKNRGNSSPPSLTCCSPLTAFAQEWMFKNTSATPSVFAEPEPGIADEEVLATPALRIDQLFNIMAAGPSDEPGEMAALRANMLSQFHMRQASPDLDDRSGFLAPTVIALGTGMLLIGGVLGSTKLHAFALPLLARCQCDRAMLLIGRIIRLTPPMSRNPLAGSDPVPASVSG